MSVIIQGFSKFKNVIAMVVSAYFLENGLPLISEDGETITLE